MIMNRYPFLCLLLGLSGLTLCPRIARADCYWQSSGYAQTWTFSFPSTITPDPGVAVGGTIATSSTVNPGTAYAATCSGALPGGVVNGSWTQPVSGTVYPTNIPGVGYKLVSGSYAMPAYPTKTTTPGQYGNAADLVLQMVLVKTGPIQGGMLSSGQFATDLFDTLVAYKFALGNPVTINAPSCMVNTASQNMTVTLPTISPAALVSAGATAGRTPFNIGLTCSATGANVLITMATSNTYAGANGVVAPTTGAGYASNVGVQILNGQSSPITFNAAQDVGAEASSMSIPYYAQYYATSTPVGSGQVMGTVTFTLSYQ